MTSPRPVGRRSARRSARPGGNRTQRRAPLLTSFVAVSLLVVGVLQAQEKPDLSSLSVDDLMNVEVTSVSRKGQRLSDTAAAVFVISQDDIRRSGATSIPEILRIVPGLDVARVNGNVWAISARGSNGQFANKLLVMIDGRSVYTPLFSGVFWDAQDTLLEDVERIEVIRGPGGTLWGANAVNGIINIITKHAIDTQGTLVSADAGAANGSAGEARFGGKAGPNGYYRLFGKTFDRPASVAGVDKSNDAWTVGRAGFRADWASRGGDNFTAQGDIYRGTEATLGAFDPTNPLVDRSALDHVAGQDIQFKWTAIQSSRSDTTLQAFYDYTARTQPTFVENRRTFDVDFQQHLKLGRSNDAVWGAEYRNSSDSAAGPVVHLVRDSNVESLATAFVQDEILVGRRLRVTVGTKVQYGTAAHLQLQPTLRLLFKASERQTFWAAATDAVRTPSEIELYGRVNVGAFPDGSAAGGLIVLTGNPDLEAERVLSYEVGYRWQATPRMALDATAYYNRLRDLVLSAPGAPGVDPAGRTIIPINFANSVNGTAVGAELLVTDSVTTNWNLALGYAFYRSPSTQDFSSPGHQLQLRSSVELPRQLELDASAYYVSALTDISGLTDIPQFLRLDGQISWHPARRWSVSVSGQNLLHSRHSEFVGTNGESDLGTPSQRTVNGKITWRY